MDSSVMEDSVFDIAQSSDFSPPPKVKSKPTTASKKPAATSKTSASKTKAASKGAPTQTTLGKKNVQAKKRRAPAAENEDESSMEGPSAGDDSLLSVTPPSAKKQKKAPASKKPAGNPLQQLQNEVAATQSPDAKGKGSAEKYQKLTQIEHILKRPDTYVGSVERTQSKMWVYNSTSESMELRDVSFVPGLYKIFDEILVNAADNKQRDKNMDAVQVTVDREAGEISVYNNGRGIPIEMHDKEHIYIPELIFGHLLTSSNYDDNQQKVTGGRNGFGAKLCNIFSTTFKIETADSKSKQKYQQVWKSNMSHMGSPKITSNSKGDEYTKVTFTPDFEKFGMDGMDDDFEAIVKRRVYDLAGTSRGALKVTLNKERIKIKTFKQYMEMYAKALNSEQGEDAPADISKTLITEQPDARWEIGFAVSDGSFQQVSFVNSIATTSGGTHVNHIADQLVNRLMEVVKKKDKKGVALKNSQIRNHIFLFVNCLIVNPAFTSQTKEQLTTKASSFGSTCRVSDSFLKKVADSEAVKRLQDFALRQADQALKRTDGSRRARMTNPKLTDANKAGTKDGWKCTLILTEGDSAKGLAMAGRAVVGPDEFGVFPLRGKLLNVRDASIDQISKNAEIQSIKQFLGLQHKKEYTDTKSLRYGHIMIMTDQDHDGSHIKGLLINFLQCSFPSLLRIPQFLIEFITPIVKVWKGDPKNPSRSKSFFTMPEYEAWLEEHKTERGWEHKYYKGLGTSSTEDAQIYFGDLDRHLKEFHTMKENEEKMIELAFSKKKADERKEWLRQFKPGTYLDHSIDKISYDEFVNKELILFSMADNIRSIPSVIDGMKPGQRKVLYACLKRNLRRDVKVAELAGHVSGTTGYQHGETSLQQTIVNLAQTFAGSNNVNLLEPSGNFGSRLQGGNDCASARYIYTRLSPFARKVFSKLDDPLYTYNMDDGKQIEPEVYCPVVPMVLVNGADGIGTGWSTTIPNYNPEDIVTTLRGMMNGEITADDPINMSPWFRGWHGEVTQIGPDKYKFSGIIKQTGDRELEITELPIRVWTQDFKDRLEEAIKAEKTTSFIKDYTDYNTHIKVHFIIQMDENQMKVAVETGLEEKFKLSKTVATSNLVAFNEEGRLQKYNDVKEIMWEFYYHRLKLYQKRKLHQLAELQKELDKMSNQARFVQMIIDGKMIVSKKKKSVLIAELREKKFTPFPKVQDAAAAGETEQAAEDEEEPDDTPDASAYDYLLGMAIWSLTQERVEKLRKQIGLKEEEIDTLNKLSPRDLWVTDLDDFIESWRFELDDEAKRQKKAASRGRRGSSKLQVSAKNPKAKKRKAMGDDPEDSDFTAAKPKKGSAPARAKSKPVAGIFKHEEGPAKAQTAKATDIVNEIKAEAEGDRASESRNTQSPRRPRAATTKTVAYGGSSESESDGGDDFLGDVSTMVKGIGKSSGLTKAGERTLFSESRSRPSSSLGPASQSKAGAKPSPDALKAIDESTAGESRKPNGMVVDETVDAGDIDDPSAQPANRATLERDVDESESEDEFLNIANTGAKGSKGPSKPAAAAKSTASKGRGKKQAAPAAKSSAKQTAAPAATKARAKPKAPSKAAGRGKKKADSDSEADAGDVDAMANDLLDSESEAEPAPVPKTSRPARKAATTKKKPAYLDSDEDDDLDAEEPSSDDFDEDDDE